MRLLPMQPYRWIPDIRLHQFIVYNPNHHHHHHHHNWRTTIDSAAPGASIRTWDTNRVMARPTSWFSSSFHPMQEVRCLQGKCGTCLDPWAFVCFVLLATSSFRCLLISCGTGSLSSWPSRCPAWSTSLCSGEVISCFIQTADCFCLVFLGLCLCWQEVTHSVILKKKDISLFVGRKTFLPSKD